MAYLEELLPKFRKGAKIRRKSWDNKSYIHLKGEECCDEAGYSYDLNISLVADDWELYQEPDWDYIIKNKCLCWFWDDNENGKYLGTIRFINKNDELPFVNWERGYAKNSRPVRRDEVTFYEDKK